MQSLFTLQAFTILLLFQSGIASDAPVKVYDNEPTAGTNPRGKYSHSDGDTAPALNVTSSGGGSRSPAPLDRVLDNASGQLLLVPPNPKLKWPKKKPPSGKPVNSTGSNHGNLNTTQKSPKSKPSRRDLLLSLQDKVYNLTVIIENMNFTDPNGTIALAVREILDSIDHILKIEPKEDNIEQEKMKAFTALIRNAVITAFIQLRKALSHRGEELDDSLNPRTGDWSLAMGIGIALGTIIGAVIGTVALAKRLGSSNQKDEEQQPKPSKNPSEDPLGGNDPMRRFLGL